MGFFDGMKAILDPKRWYTEPRLYEYFHYEIIGIDNPEGFKYSVTTNIRKVIDEYTKEYFPEANVYKTKIEPVWGFTGNLEKCDEEFYKISYIGKIQVYNAYGDYEGNLYYRVIVYTNKYAELSKLKGQETTIEVSKKTLKI